ncbi:MAG: uridine kinase [Actinobacteria bacterium]|nr:uridine kinase [Actinomycetota bacterium]MCI0544260.1 uridine kinase [Actinomycetota bacterium]MCI0677786.1 uridine kinase [Actinomycetota bacterium]
MPDRGPWQPDRPLFIGIAGGSGSGKTTVAHAVLERLDGSVALLQHDAYYRHQPHLSLDERTRVNYDHPSSLETELLVEHLETLRSGVGVNRPVYDFAQHLRSDDTVWIEPGRVVIVEGILVLAEDSLRSELDLKIFVDTDPDLRLARRLERDISERGRTVDSVITQYFASVRPMHIEFVQPSMRYADLIIPEGYNPAAVATVVELIRSRLHP